MNVIKYDFVESFAIYCNLFRMNANENHFRQNEINKAWDKAISIMENL